MKKTGYIELFANIKKTLISFISITMFVFLGIGVLLGLSWSGMAMKDSLDVAYKRGNAHDLQITYLYGVNKQEAEEFLKYDNVDEVELEFKAYEEFSFEDKLYQASITSYNNNIDTFTLLEGSLPTKDNEILIEKGSSENTNLKVGDTVTFSNGNGKSNRLLNIIKDYSSDKFDETVELLDKEYKNLKLDTYKIVGIIEHPAYLSKSQASYGVNDNGMQINALFFLDYNNFNEEITNNYYSSILIKSNSLNNVISYQEEFDNQVDQIKADITSKAEELNTTSYQRVKSKLDLFLKDAYQKIEDGQKEIDQAEIDIKDGEKEIISNEKKLKDAKVELDDGKAKLDDALKEINEAENLINENEALLNANEQELLELSEKFEATKNAYATFFDNLDTNIATLKQCLADPYDLDNILTIIDIIEYFENGYTINDVEAIFTNYGISPSESLQKDIDDFKDDYDEFKYNFLIDVIDEFVQAQSSDEAVLLIKDIINKVNNDEMTYEQAISELNKDYKNGKSLYKYVLSEMYDDAAVAILTTSNNYDNQISNLSGRAKAIVARSFAELQVYLDYAKLQLNDAKQKLNEAKAQLNSGIATYNKNYKLYEDSLKEYEDGVNKLAKARKDLAQAKIDLEQAKEDIAEAKKDYDELVDETSVIKEYNVTILTRNENAVGPYIKLISDIIIKLKYSLGGLFLIISIMVCYSVVTRNVNDQIKEIGTKKALGLYDKEITISCLAYTLMSVIIGSLFGVILAVFGLEKVIVPSVKGSFNFTMVAKYYDLKELFIAIIGELVLMSSVTYFGCKNVLKLDAVKLLQGKQPPENKNRFFEKSSIWQKLSLLNKTIINNCLNDPMRVIATVVGVAGCTALIVSSITLKDNVQSSFDKQYAEYFNFDSFVYFDSDNEEGKEKMEAYFDEHDITYANVYRSLTYIQLRDDPKYFGYEMVFEDSPEFRQLVVFETNNTNFDYKGVWIPESYEKYYGLTENEATTLTSATGDSYDTNIKGYYKYYSYMLQIYMDSNTYSEITGEEYKPNIYLIDLNGNDFKTVSDDLKNIEGFTSILDYYHYCKQDVDIFTSVSTAMVGVYLVISILMSIFVLLNLYATFIEEKKRELIVLMINGYTIKQANRYIYSDTIFLTIIGLIIGLGVGIFVGDLSVSSFEGNALYLMHGYDIYACIAGIIITSFLSFLMCRIALKKIKDFELTDINKA